MWKSPPRDLPSERFACIGFSLSKKSLPNRSSSGKRLLSAFGKGYSPLRENVKLRLNILPMQLAWSHHCEMVLICRYLAQQCYPGTGFGSPSFPFPARTSLSCHVSHFSLLRTVARPSKIARSLSATIRMLSVSFFLS